jgi:hypothetical protein
MTPYTIEIDCPPGNPRPDELLPGVIKDTGITLDDLENVGRFFGNWTWRVKPEANERYALARKTIADRLKALHASGHTRYSSW